MAPYPTKDEIHQFALAMGAEDRTPFMSRVAPDCTWDIMGTHPLAGKFDTVTYVKKIQGRIQAVLNEKMRATVYNTIGGGDQEWAVIEMNLEPNTCKNGMRFPQIYAWVMRFNEHGQIVEVRVYLDSQLVQTALDQNE